MEVKRETDDLREVYRKFVAPTSIIHKNDALMIAESSEWIRVKGEKFYLIRNGGSETKRIFCKDPDCIEIKAHGFIALLKDHPNYPKDKQLFAFQCDECKMIYIMNIPKKKSE